MVHAYHLIMTAYGFWLPNDPRGSCSDVVAAWELLRFGPATTVQTRRSVAGDEHDRAWRMFAKDRLKYPPVSWRGFQAREIARGFAEYSARSELTVWACAILPEHVHLVFRRAGNRKCEQIATSLKSAATKRLKESGAHPYQWVSKATGTCPKMWARGCWKVFLDSDSAIKRAIQYVEDNPVREGKRRQDWNFVRPLR